MVTRTVSAKRAVHARGLTYQELADALGYGLSTIKNAMAGITRPSQTLREALGELLDVEPETLVFGDCSLQGRSPVRTAAVRGPRQ
jgi:transcriptional regulator with XRE-family HTH domain